MNVVFATSPHFKHAAVLESDFIPRPSAMYTFAPVGLLSLYSVVRASTGWQPRLFDTNRHVRAGDIPCDANFYQATAELLSELSPDVIGFMTECDSYHHVLQICEHLKRIRPSCWVVLGGPHASAVADATMARYECIDAIVKGEGEKSLPLLLEYLEKDYRPVPVDAARSAMLLRNGQMQVQHLLEYRLVDNLDDLPIPAYDVYQPDEGEEIFMEVGRGCPFSCQFCSTAPFWNRRQRVKSPQRIIDEIMLLRKLFSVERLHFTHDLFTTDRKWVVRVCEVLAKKNLPVTWTCSARTDTVDIELLQLMKSAGCRAIYFGMESGSHRMLKEIHKEIPIEHSLSMLKKCAAAGIVPNVGFILGFPTEDQASMADTFSAYTKAVRLGAKPAHLFGYCPFAQSSMFGTAMAIFRHDGHYVDLPLGAEADTANRTLIGSAPELFGSYYRVAQGAVPDLLEGIDEFSPLVEATIVPSLLVADLLQEGMFELYRHWLSSIRRKNQIAGKPPWRRSYGSVIDYVIFLREFVRACKHAPVYLDSLLRATEIGLRVACSPPPPTSMDSYRSFSTRVDSIHVGSDDIVEKGEVQAVEMFSYDITGMLLDSPNVVTAQIEPALTYLVWQKHQGRVRILRVSSFVYHVLTLLQRSNATVSDLSLLDPSLDPSENRNQLLQAAVQGLLKIGQSANETL